MKTYLDSLELAVARVIADERDRRGGGKFGNNLMGHQIDDAHFIGVCGEIAMAKIFCVYFNMVSLDIPWDLIVNGYTFDVKCNGSGVMYIHPKCVDKNIDGFAYVRHIGGNCYDYMGVISRKRLLRDFEPEPSKHSDCYQIHPSSLTDVPPVVHKENTNEVSK